MDEPWKEVLLESREAIIRSCDPNNVFLYHVLDHMESKKYIHKDHVMIIKNEVLMRGRVNKLFDFVSSEGAFDELCNAFRTFNIVDTLRLADELQQDLRHKKEGQAIEVQQLKAERDQLRTERDQLKAERDQLKTEKDQLKTERDQFKAERDQLKTEKVQLKTARDQPETILAFCTEQVKFIHLHSMNEDKPIFGLTTLNNELYVHYGGNTDITVYDTETYSVQRSLRVPLLGDVRDMTSCKIHQCIYIADDVNKVVHRVDNKNTITQWPVNEKPHGMSVNAVYRVLVTCGKVGKVKEFTTDGWLIREISLESSIVNPSHTLELTTGQLVVCHGWEKNDAMHRVCIVDLSGCVLQSYGGSKGSDSGQLKAPVRLVVNGSILVADCDNHRVLMLSPSLSLMCEVVPRLRYPRRLWFDDETGRLYVADNKYENNKWVSGQVKVYGV